MKAEGGRMKGRQTAFTSSFILPPSSVPSRSVFCLFLVDSLDSYVRAEACDDEAVAHVEAAGEGGLVLRVRLAGVVAPDLAVGAVAFPAEVAVGDGLYREELEASQQPVAFGHFDRAPEHLYLDEAFVRV